MNRKIFLSFALFLGLALVSGLAAAQSQSAPPEQRVSGDFRYVSGGIGLMERGMLEAMARDYNLKLVFAGESGPYLSDVQVSVRDMRGMELLNAVSNGPWFLLKAPEGTYLISATFRGETETKKITVDRLLKTVDFYWPAPAERLSGIAGAQLQPQPQPAPLGYRMSGEFVYVSGGIGSAEREALDAMARDYNLKLVFAGPAESSISDIQVSVKDTRGTELLNTVSNGPWFLLKAPEGTYLISATFRGETETKRITVDRSFQTVDFYWPAPAERLPGIAMTQSQPQPQPAPQGYRISGEFVYVSGGIGSAEREALDATARDYNLKLVFAGQAEPYISDVEVSVKDTRGTEILSTVSNGPWFFLKAPIGTYLISATFQGETETKRITIDRSLQTVDFYWPAPAERLSGIVATQPQPQSAPLEQRTSGNFMYVSGGIGSAERDMLEATARDYNLKLVFSGQAGPYISDVEVSVRDTRGMELLNAVSDGPWFYLNAPEGAYIISATFRGQTKTKRITLGRSLKTVNFFWVAPARRLPEWEEQ